MSAKQLEQVAQATKTAFVFPGQGSQKVDMLAELAEQFSSVTETFAEASAAVGFDLWQIAQSGEGLNQTEFADKLETSQNLISKYEKGQVELPFKIINNMNKVFNININWLLTGKGLMFESDVGDTNISFQEELINDIKKLSPKRQEYYYHKIKADLIEEELDN